VKIWMGQVGKGETAWAVFVNDEPVMTGLTKREAESHFHWVQFCASPEARAAARERICGG